jgi:hypothetical protein
MENRLALIDSLFFARAIIQADAHFTWGQLW